MTRHDARDGPLEYGYSSQPPSTTLRPPLFDTCSLVFATKKNSTFPVPESNCAASTRSKSWARPLRWRYTRRPSHHALSILSTESRPRPRRPRQTSPCCLRRLQSRRFRHVVRPWFNGADSGSKKWTFEGLDATPAQGSASRHIRPLHRSLPHPP
jgi:hypothetical protein